MQNNYNAHPASRSSTVQSELLKIFMDLNHYEEKNRNKAKAQKKLAARRAIEQHFEKKALEQELDDYWAE